MDVLKAFESIDIRVGTIIKAELFHEVKNPAYKLWIDFGELGIKKSSAQLTILYEIEDLLNKQVVAVVNLEAKQIANFMSECLVLGAVGLANEVSLLGVDRKVKNGVKIA